MDERQSPFLLALCLSVTIQGLSIAGAVADEPIGRLNLDPDEVRPGLMAIYRPLGVEANTFHRVDAKPAFTLGHSSPHPRIPAGPFEVTWEGVILINDPGPISFGAFVSGELELEVDGEVVLRGAGASESSRIDPAGPLDRPPGRYVIRIRYRSLEEHPARLQIDWEGPSFSREPLPAWRLSHLVERVTPNFLRTHEEMMGRALVGRLGCARCHRDGLPAVDDPPPGPSLADATARLDRDWLMHWLDDPSGVRDGARMPALFSDDRSGAVERWLLANALGREDRAQNDEPPSGDHRLGRRDYLSIGCAACHLVPDRDRGEQFDPELIPFVGLADRMTEADLAAFLGNPHGRYPDGRMPRLAITPESARNIAAYLLMWCEPTPDVPTVTPPTAEEVGAIARRLGVPNRGEAVTSALLSEKGCVSCHTGLGATLPRSFPISANAEQGCPERIADHGPRYTLDAASRASIAAYLSVAAEEIHPSPFEARQRHLDRAGCVRCHQRDTDRPPPIEEIGQSLGGAYLETIPYQRTPRLTDPLRKLTRRHVLETVREGGQGTRSPSYTYRMPAFGPHAEALVQAIAEADGELIVAPEPEPSVIEDPTLGTLIGPELVGSRGYGCISCHVWDGRQFSQPDPGAIGPDLTRVVGRIRRDWFDRFVEDPSRLTPGTPMPAIFPGGQAMLASVLEGDADRQRDALWGYFSMGAEAPAPEPPAPMPIVAPKPGEPALVAQVPIRSSDGTLVESLTLLNDQDDLLLYDLSTHAPRTAFVGGQILRTVQGRTRQFLAEGDPIGLGLAVNPEWQFIEQGGIEIPIDWTFLRYDRLGDGFRIRSQALLGATTFELEDVVRIVREQDDGRLIRGIRLVGLPQRSSLGHRLLTPDSIASAVSASTGEVETKAETDQVTLRFAPDENGVVEATLALSLPPSREAPAWEGATIEQPSPEQGSLERPGYQAFAFPRLKTISGEDRIMPSALAVDPDDGRLFVASMKTGELFVVNNPRNDPTEVRIENYARGLFQDAFSMLAEDDGLYVLHRRNLSRLTDEDGDGLADRFDRMVGLPHGVADTYDYAYGLVRDPSGGFVVSYAPYANTTMQGSGGVLRLVPGEPPKEVAFGLRNPLGWCSGPEGEIFFTDNQGEWVATNKLCHVEEGRFYGFPNPAQPQHADRPAGKPVVWVPYQWARSINGVAYDHTEGAFGPFAGQFFMAELMFGGAIIRANVEQVKGQYQGACFPFWGAGLLGPVSLAFDPAGPLYVGGITEPGWMAQPDRGALFRIDFTGATPFEMREIHALPQGFRINFTSPIAPQTAVDPASYRIEQHRYEYTGAYGSPELDRTVVDLEQVLVSPDRLSVDLTTSPLVKDRVYMIDASGVRSESADPLVHPIGAYTLNEIPD